MEPRIQEEQCSFHPGRGALDEAIQSLYNHNERFGPNAGSMLNFFQMAVGLHQGCPFH